MKRRSSEGKKPRSPSQRRIGVIRRRSREKGEKSPNISPTNRERGRSTLPKHTVNKKSPNTKVHLTPRLGEGEIKGRLARGRPNSTSSGLEKPSASPVVMPGPNGKVVIKHSFRKERPEIGTPLRQPKQDDQHTHMKTPPSSSSVETRSMRRQSESITQLRQDIQHLIENSFGDNERHASESFVDEDVFVDSVDAPSGNMAYKAPSNAVSAPDNLFRRDVSELSSRMANVSFERMVDLQSDVRDSPMTRSQLRRQSSAFEFAKPDPACQQRENLRRQSSAFEFRSGPVEPIYENLSRDVSARASLR